MKKKVISILLAATMVLGLAACSSSESSESSESSGSETESEETATSEESGGKVVNVYWPSDTEEMLDGAIEAYADVNPDIEVVKHIIPNDDYDDKIKVLLSGGAEDVDVFWARTPAQTNQYRTAGALEDLTPYAEKSDVDLTQIQSILDVISDDNGDFYGLPIYSPCWLLYYNEELFDEAGIEYPGQLTWDEYCELAESLVKTVDGTKYWGGMCPDWTMNLGAIAAGEYLSDPAPLEKTADYLEITHRMYSESNMPIGDMSNGSWDINASWESGTIYMMIDGDWGLGQLDCDFAYGIAPLPIMDGAEPGTSVGNPTNLCMTTTASNKQECYDFIEFMTTSDAGTSAIAKTLNVPSYTTDAALETYKELVNVDGIEYRFEANVLPEQSSDDDYAAINEAFTQEGQLYLLDEESLDDCMNNFYEMRDEIKGN